MKRNVVIIGGVVIVLLAIAGVFGWQRVNASAATATHLQTANVQRGTLVATIDAAGNVSAPELAGIAFQTSGKVAKVDVQVGDKVKAGQVLMSLDTTDLNLAVKTAQVNLASAQANYDQSKSNLDVAVKTAQNSLTTAQANYDAAKLKNDQNPNQLIVAKAALDKAAVTLQQAQAAYNAIAWRPDVGMTSQAATLQTATSDYNSALANYQITASGINDTALRSAQASLDQAKVALDEAKNNQVTSLKVSQASLDNAQVALDQAKRNLDKATLTAPFDGYISAVNFSAGDTPSGTAVSLANLSNLQVKVMVAEVDVAKLKVGDTAQMTLDALPGQTYTAKVISIGPTGTITQGVVNYPVTVAVTNADPGVKPGMTANLSVAVDQRQNVLMVPNRAVRNQGNQKIVTVLYKGQSIEVPVQTGLTNDQYTEVMSGLQVGDQVVLNQTTTTNRGGGGVGGIFRFGGGR